MAEKPELPSIARSGDSRGDTAGTAVVHAHSRAAKNVDPDPPIARGNAVIELAGATGGCGGRRVWELMCRGVSVARSGAMVLREIDLNIRSGECVALIGPNGSGKSTLMMTLLGLLKSTRGAVELNGTVISRVRPRERGKWAAYVPQLLEGGADYTVYDMVAAGRYPHLSPLAPLSREDLEAVQRALDQCGLTELAERPISGVSGGERQKTLIAAAIAQDAEVMFLDEPNTALDPAYQIELVRLLRGWHASGRGVVLISHDLHLPAALDCRVVALREGRMVADDVSERVLDPERLREIFGAEFVRVATADGAVVLPRF